MQVTMRPIRPDKPPNWRGILDEVEKTMDVGGPVAKRGLSYFERITASWKHNPAHKAKVRNTARSLITWIGPTGEYAKYWGWITFGTPEREIVPKKPGGVLVFPTSYQPKTSPGGSGRYRGPGRAVGPTVFVKKVRKHKIRARKFEVAIARWSRPWFAKTIRAAIRKGAGRA